VRRPSRNNNNNNSVRVFGIGRGKRNYKKERIVRTKPDLSPVVIGKISGYAGRNFGFTRGVGMCVCVCVTGGRK